MSIRKLGRHLVNQIAAGEVVERPASVVKELVENSLDAGAVQIDVAIEDRDGSNLIRISDNGGGISVVDLPLAVAPHATSKIASSGDLASIGTLGFRGEALASIASVSQLRLTSRAASDHAAGDAGYVIEVQDGEVSEPVPVACLPGTILEVRNLFFNTPARRKFLRAPATEYGHIADVVTRIALAWTDVGLTLTRNGRRHLGFEAGQDRRQRCVDVLGSELDEALLGVADQAAMETGVSVPKVVSVGTTPVLWGLAGSPSIARASAKFQHFFLNGRPIRDRNIAHAVKEAYRGLMPHDRHPVAIVMLEVDAASVDVNVHPTKAEVRFHEPSRIHHLVLTAFRQCLLRADLTPTVSIQDQAYLSRVTSSDLTPVTPGPTLSGGGGSSLTPVVGGSMSLAGVAGLQGKHHKGFEFEQVKQQLASGGHRVDDVDQTADISRLAGLSVSRSGQDATVATSPPWSARRVLQVHKSFLVTEDEQGLVIIDQHALHERFMFEQLKHRVLKQNLESQRLLVLATFSANAKRLAMLEQLQPLLQRVGIEAHPVGPSAIGIAGFSSFLFDRKVDPVEFVEQLLDRGEQGDFDTEASNAEEAALHHVLDMMACKAAVKAGDKMSEEELFDLLDQRDRIERSSSCPHGRPTAVRLTLSDLYKYFKRT